LLICIYLQARSYEKRTHKSPSLNADSVPQKDRKQSTPSTDEPINDNRVHPTHKVTTDVSRCHVHLADSDWKHCEDEQKEISICLFSKQQQWETVPVITVNQSISAVQHDNTATERTCKTKLTAQLILNPKIHWFFGTNAFLRRNLFQRLVMAFLFGWMPKRVPRVLVHGRLSQRDLHSSMQHHVLHPLAITWGHAPVTSQQTTSQKSVGLICPVTETLCLANLCQFVLWWWTIKILLSWNSMQIVARGLQLADAARFVHSWCRRCNRCVFASIWIFSFAQCDWKKNVQWFAQHICTPKRDNPASSKPRQMQDQTAHRRMHHQLLAQKTCSETQVTSCCTQTRSQQNSCVAKHHTSNARMQQNALQLRCDWSRVDGQMMLCCWFASFLLSSAGWGQSTCIFELCAGIGALIWLVDIAHRNFLVNSFLDNPLFTRCCLRPRSDVWFHLRTTKMVSQIGLSWAFHVHTARLEEGPALRRLKFN